MKEQVVTPRAPARGMAAGKGRASGIVQKPARRSRHASDSRARGGTLRKVLAYLPLAGKVMLAVLAGVLLFTGYRAAASASFFQAHVVDINPTTRANADEINRVVRRAMAQTGVWRADLEAISAELERVPWVRRAVVSRVLPDGLRVRVTERTPFAVVRMNNGKFVWVDEDAVTLDTMTATDHQPTFFIRGWDESGTDTARAENRERLKTYAELLRNWEADGLSERVSEVELTDLQNVRVQLAGNDSQIEVRFLGEKNLSSKLNPALKYLDSRKSLPCGPFINYLIVKPDNSVVLGKEPGSPPCDGVLTTNSGVAETERAKTSAVTTEPDRPAGRNKETKEKAPRADKEQRAKKEQDKKEEAKRKAKGETRPRRVG